jgi:hypothetical protein
MTVGFTLVLLVALALVGGLGAAASSSGKAAKNLTRAAGKADKVATAVNTPAQDQYKPKCNSGRGNLSETGTGNRSTNSGTLINPHTGGQGPGSSPTDDCDPGNSGSHNSGGD